MKMHRYCNNIQRSTDKHNILLFISNTVMTNIAHPVSYVGHYYVDCILQCAVLHYDVECILLCSMVVIDMSDVYCSVLWLS